MPRLAIVGSILLMAATIAAGSPPPPTVPVIYCTDLFHPHDDPDDHFDLVTMYAIPEFRIEAIILDDGGLQETRPGHVAVDQMNHLTGRRVPWAIGLAARLRSPDDEARDGPAKFQRGIETILDVLEEAQPPVTIITVGSMRDVAAALNRSPDLFRRKVARILCFIGEARGGHDEHNVRLDPHAFVRILNSGLTVDWVPCFDRGVKKGQRHASYWKASHAELLRDAPEPLLAFFAYALLHKKEKAPLEALQRTVSEEERRQVLAPTRNLWCTAVFTYAAGRRFVKRGDRWTTVAETDLKPAETAVDLFGFEPVSLFAHDAGEVTYEKSARAHVVNRFRVLERKIYADAMTSATRELIRDLGTRLVTRAKRGD